MSRRTRSLVVTSGIVPGPLRLACERACFISHVFRMVFRMVGEFFAARSWDIYMRKGLVSASLNS